MELVGQNNIAKLIVYGDAKKVIQKMRTDYKRGTTICRRIYDRIPFLNSDLQATYFHILKGNNTIANKLTNQGVKNKLGIVSIRCQPNFQNHVP